MEGAAAEDQGTLFLEETLAEDDSVYNLDCDADALKKEGWKTDPKFFKKVRVSGGHCASDPVWSSGRDSTGILSDSSVSSARSLLFTHQLCTCHRVQSTVHAPTVEPLLSAEPGSMAS